MPYRQPRNLPPDLPPRPRFLAPPSGLLAVAVLALSLLIPLACGGDRSSDATAAAAADAAVAPEAVAPSTAGTADEPEVAPTASEATSETTTADGTPGAPEAVADPADPAGRTDRTELADQASQEREELARKQRELDAREARLDRREAALRESSNPAETAERTTRTAATAPPPTDSAEEGRVAAAPADPVTDTGDVTRAPDQTPAQTPADTADDDWRRSSYRTDPAARDGYDPAPPAEGTQGATTDSVDGWSDEPAREPAIAPARQWTSELLPAGTRFTVELLDTLASDRNQAGDTFRARVVEDVTRGGDVVIPAGSTVRGRVTEAVPLDRKVGGRARLGLQFYELEPPGAGPASIDADFAAKGKSETAKDAATIGGAAAAGAILGRVLNRGNKGKGSVLGAIVGAAAGTAIAAHNEGEEIELPEGAQVELVLTQPAEVPVRVPGQGPR